MVMVMVIKMTVCADGAYDDHLQVYILLPKNQLFLPKDPNTKVIDPQWKTSSTLQASKLKAVLDRSFRVYNQGLDHNRYTTSPAVMNEWIFKTISLWQPFSPSSSPPQLTPPPHKFTETLSPPQHPLPPPSPPSPPPPHPPMPALTPFLPPLPPQSAPTRQAGLVPDSSGSCSEVTMNSDLQDEMNKLKGRTGDDVRQLHYTILLCYSPPDFRTLRKNI